MSARPTSSSSVRTMDGTTAVIILQHIWNQVDEMSKDVEQTMRLAQVNSQEIGRVQRENDQLRKDYKDILAAYHLLLVERESFLNQIDNVATERHNIFLGNVRGLDKSKKRNATLKETTHKILKATKTNSGNVDMIVEKLVEVMELFEKQATTSAEDDILEAKVRGSGSSTGSVANIVGNQELELKTAEAAETGETATAGAHGTTPATGALGATPTLEPGSATTAPGAAHSFRTPAAPRLSIVIPKDPMRPPPTDVPRSPISPFFPSIAEIYASGWNEEAGTVNAMIEYEAARAARDSHLRERALAGRDQNAENAGVKDSKAKARNAKRHKADRKNDNN